MPLELPLPYATYSRASNQHTYDSSFCLTVPHLTLIGDAIVNTNGVIERFDQSLKCEHLYQREIDTAAELADEVATTSRSATRSGRAIPWAGASRSPCTLPGHTYFRALAFNFPDTRHRPIARRTASALFVVSSPRYPSAGSPFAPTCAARQLHNA